MKSISFRVVRVATFFGILLGSWSAAAQGIIRSGTFAPITPPGLAGYHIDAWSIVSPRPIRTFEATVRINPMNQVQPGGSLSVFPTLLSATERAQDSHFLFDTSSANILAQNEDTTMLTARVEFTSNFPSSFDLVKVVARDGHSPFEVRVSGTYLDGSLFSDSEVFVPEPSTAILIPLGLAVVMVRRKVRAR
jgi:hypothetical protein